jgi:hypothetical protein
MIKIIMHNKYSLSTEQFEILREKLNHRTGLERFDEANVESAYAVMVKGVSVAKEAKISKRSRQNLHRVVRDLWAIFNDIEPPSRAIQRQHTLKEKTPKSWVRVTVTLPAAMAKLVQELEVQARALLEYKGE